MAHARSRLGARGEEAARKHLEANGYQVLDTNYRCPWGEVDIVARHEDALVFVEVRSRRRLTYGTPEESLTKRKIERLVATAESYLQACQQPPAQWRIDLVAVQMGPSGRIQGVSHLENAVQLN